MLTVHIRDSQGQVLQYPFDKDAMTLGRSADSSVRLTDRNVSRNHAKLTRDGEAVYIEESSARYGTYVNGERLVPHERVRIGPGDDIRLGDYVLQIEGAGMVAKPVAAPNAGAKAATGTTALVDISQVQAALAASDVPTTIDPAQQVKLVVVSSNMAGREIPIDHSPLIIGRVPECDVVLNHRSISQRHAKITFHNNSFHITDIGAANRIYVNREPYAHIELQKGDLIELGHIKLRVALPHETVAPEPESEASIGEPEHAEGRSRRARSILIFLAVIILCGGLAAFLFLYIWPSSTIENELPGHPNELNDASSLAVSGSGADSKSATSSETTGSASGSDAQAKTAEVAQSGTDTGKKAPATAPQSGDPPALDEATALIKSEDWDKATKLLREISSKYPDNARVRELLSHVTTEKAIAETYGQIKRLADKGQTEKALSDLNKQVDPSSSAYYERFQQLRTRVKRDLIVKQVDNAKKQFKASQFKAVLAACKTVFELDAENKDCKQMTAEARKQEGVTQPAPGPGDDLFNNPNALLKEAKSARADKDYVRAVELLKTALKLPGAPRRALYQELALAYEGLDDKSQAIGAYRMILRSTTNPDEQQKLTDKIKSLGGTP